MFGFDPAHCKVRERDAEIIAIDDKLGFTLYTCPVCGAALVFPNKDNTQRLICLNACHLGPGGQARFNAFITGALKKEGLEP
jgi:hypothetical protein